MKALTLTALVFSAALIAGPPPHVVSPELRAESWVKEATALAKAKGIDAVVAEISSPKSRFKTDKPEKDPELTIYSNGLKVLAQNRVSRHVGMEHAKIQNAAGVPYLAKMLVFAKKSGPGWFEYQGHDASNQERAFKAYVALHEEHLFVASIPK